MGFTIKNTSKNQQVAFHRGKSIVELPPGKERSFGVDDLASGVLRFLERAKHVKLTALTDEAKGRVEQALVRTKKRTFDLVHGSGDISAEQAHEIEGAGRVRQVLDRKTPKLQSERRYITDPANPSLPKPKPPEPPVEQPREKEQPPAQPQKPEEALAQHVQPTPPAELSPAAALLYDMGQAGEIPPRELRRRAKEVLGDSYPPGSQVGREEITAALTAKLSME